MTTPPGPSHAVVVGVGEIGRWIAGAMLHAGTTVIPVNRHQSVRRTLEGVAAGTPILVAVPEAALPSVLEQIPSAAAPDLLLVQNGTFPSDLQGAIASHAGWCVVWTLRRRGESPVTGQPTAISGPHGRWLAQSMVGVGESAHAVGPMEVRRELACKFAFILAINGVGLTHEGTLGEALTTRGDELRDATRECLAVTMDMAATEATDMESLVERAATAMRNMHGMRIRSGAARARLQRALEHAQAHALPHEWLRRVLV